MACSLPRMWGLKADHVYLAAAVGIRKACCFPGSYLRSQVRCLGCRRSQADTPVQRHGESDVRRLWWIEVLTCIQPRTGAAC